MGSSNSQIENKDSYIFLLKDPKHLSEAIKKGDRDIYAVDNASIVRSSKLQYENGIVKVNTLGEDVIPTPNATLIPIACLKSILCAEPVVYLDLEAQGHPLGRLRILLTCGPRRREQAIKIFTGIAGTTLKGHCFSLAGDVGSPGECIDCYNYLDANGCTSDNLLVTDPELNMCKRLVAGQVTGCKGNTNFVICTTTDTSGTAMGPELGRVLTGLDMLSTAIRQYKGFEAEQIKIVNTGLEMNI